MQPQVQSNDTNPLKYTQIDSLIFMDQVFFIARLLQLILLK